MRRIVITGAGSAMAQEVAKIYAARGASFFLLDRNEELLQAVAHDVGVRGAVHVEAVTADLTDYAEHPGLLERAEKVLGGIDVVLLAHGTLPDQRRCEKSWEKTYQALAVNQLSAMSFMAAAANVVTAGAVLAVISSVSGDRGRQSNYVYGAAKGALTIFASGLRNRLAKSGIHVLTVKPGFVDTPMTATFKKSFLWAQPETVARGIVRAIERKRNVVYLPWFWRPLMLIIRCIPEPMFMRMNL